MYLFRDALYVRYLLGKVMNANIRFKRIAYFKRLLRVRLPTLSDFVCHMAHRIRHKKKPMNKYVDSAACVMTGEPPRIVELVYQ